MTKKTIYLIALVALVVVLALGFFIGKSSQSNVLSSVRSSSDTFVQGLKAGLTDQFVVTNSGGLTAGGNVLTLTSATDLSATAYNDTLTEAQMLDNSTIVIADSNVRTHTLTLPATSTMKTLIKKIGSSRSWLVQSQNTVAATTTTVLAGTGIDLQGYSNADDVLAGGVFGLLTCWRLKTTDVMCYTTETAVAD